MKYISEIALAAHTKIKLYILFFSGREPNIKLSVFPKIIDTFNTISISIPKDFW